jgi:hypothetical protein
LASKKISADMGKTSTFDEEFLRDAHKFCRANRGTLEKSTLAGCFYCKEIYPANEIEEWVNDKAGQTALCPKCMIDSVIGDASGIELNADFLNAMHEMWFERTYRFKEDGTIERID